MKEIIETYRKNKEKINNPCWTLDKYGNYVPKNKTTWIHDWERYVPNSLKAVWKNLSPETKTALFITGEEMSKEEGWD